MTTAIILFLFFFVYSNSINSSNALVNTTLSSISEDLQCGQMSRSCSHLSTQVLHPSIFLQHNAIVTGDVDVCWHIKHLKHVWTLFRSSLYPFIVSLISFTFSDISTEKKGVLITGCPHLLKFLKNTKKTKIS